MPGVRNFRAGPIPAQSREKAPAFCLGTTGVARRRSDFADATSIHQDPARRGPMPSRDPPNRVCPRR